MWELLTSVLAPIGAAVGIPYFIIKQTIAKLAVQSFISPEPNMSIVPFPTIPGLPVINTEVAQNPDDPDAFTDMATSQMMKASEPRPKRG
jgi:hypothetical protein